MSVELMVWENFIAGDGHPGLRTREPTVPEVVEWLREQGAVDYEAAADAYVFATEPIPPPRWADLPLEQQVVKKTIARSIVDAALTAP